MSVFVIYNFVPFGGTIGITAGIMIGLAVIFVVILKLYEKWKTSSHLSKSKSIRMDTNTMKALALHYQQPYAEQFYSDLYK